MDALDDFCQSKFWDLNVTWNTHRPDFTECFQNTVLAWIPVLFLALLSPIEFLNLRKAPPVEKSITVLTIGKQILLSALVIVAIQEIAVSFTHDHPPASKLKGVLFLLSLLWVQVVTVYLKVQGVGTSATLSVFWLLSSVCEFFIYQSSIRKVFFEETPFRKENFVGAMVRFPIIFSELILNCFYDGHPSKKEKELFSPALFASFSSLLTYVWFDRIAWIGYKRAITKDDLCLLQEELATDNVYRTFIRSWKRESQHPSKQQQKQAEKKETQSSIMLPLVKSNAKRLIVTFILKLIYDMLQLVNPLLLNKLIGFSASNEPLWRGYLYSILILLNSQFMTFLLSKYFELASVVGMNFRTALTAVIYRKALTVSPASRSKYTVGEIVNLMSIDAMRFQDLMMYINLLWSCPLQIVMILYFLYGILGASSFAGMATLLVMFPLTGYFAKSNKDYLTKSMKVKDKRIREITEVLGGIRVLKLYAWEKAFINSIEDKRKEELKLIRKTLNMLALLSFTWTMTPVLIALVCFAVYILSDRSHVLTAQTAFVAFSYINILRFPLNFLPVIITLTVQGAVAIRRIGKFLHCEDLDVSSVEINSDPEYPITVLKGDFSWQKNGQLILQDISLKIQRGSLVAVIGPVGSGKSSFLSAILGEMYRISGSVSRQDSISYVSQTAWIQQDTLRNNVLFGKKYLPKKYRAVIRACSLDTDLETFPGGDQVEIGEKGINLSGGQKQRVGLARAVYADSHIYLMDDPLSAVDAHVAKHLFDHLLGRKGLLRKKTRVLVTHAASFLPWFDVIVRMEGGRIKEVGSYQVLHATSQEFRNFLKETVKEEEQRARRQRQLSSTSPADRAADLERKESLEETEDLNLEEDALRKSLTSLESISLTDEESFSYSKRASLQSIYSTSKAALAASKDGRNSPERLVQEEKIEEGQVKLSVWKNYLMTMKLWKATGCVLMFMAFYGFNVGASLWLAEWSQDTYSSDQDYIFKRNIRLVVYSILGLFQGLCAMTGSFLLASCIVRSSKLLHTQLLNSVLRAPMVFFDTTPIGRMINRFSKDIDMIDSTFPNNIRMIMIMLFGVISTLLIIVVSTPLFAIVLVPLVVLYLFLQRFYVSTSRHLKRLVSTTRSPIFSHFTETVQGASVIRAYKKGGEFCRAFDLKQDENLSCFYASLIANRWLAVKLESIGNIVIFFSSVFSVLARGTISPGVVGLSLSYALAIIQSLNMLLRTISDFEGDVVAVERILEYADVPKESEWDIPDTRPDPSWPSKGEISFLDFKARYREGLEPAIKGLTCHIRGGEKVGIVGRTGAGKSSVALALFRIIDPFEGSLVVDGVDVSQLGLHDLRSRITIIPQYPDETLWRALESSHLKPFAEETSQGLESMIAEGGENLSVGQRQLVCLARALLRNTKIIVLDEATASMDPETDALIQETIRKEFCDCTILTVAHRLNTILDSDRILVLDGGVVKEFDSPRNLLADPYSLFCLLAKDAGISHDL